VVLMLWGGQIYPANNNVGSGSAIAEEELKRSAFGVVDVSCTLYGHCER
jgi:hypothetical protein